MGLFGRKHVSGISQYELDHDHVRSRLDSVFPSYRSSSKVKRAALHTALELALDKDVNMSGTNQKGVIQKGEFDTIVNGLLDGGVISEKEAEKLQVVAEEPLKD